MSANRLDVLWPAKPNFAAMTYGRFKPILTNAASGMGGSFAKATAARRMRCDQGK